MQSDCKNTSEQKVIDKKKKKNRNNKDMKK